MEEIGRLIRESYFTLVFMFLAQGAAVIISINRRNKINQLKNFHFYPIAGLLQTIVVFSSTPLLGDESHAINRYSISLFVAIEFFILYLLEFRIILLEPERLLLKILYAGFILYVICMWVFTEAFFRYYQIFLVQSLVLLIPSILYFLQIFRLTFEEDLTKQPAFWLNIGILFFFSSNVPLFLLEMNFRNFITHNTYLYSINYFAYGIFYLLICKAYLCKPTTRLNYSLS